MHRRFFEFGKQTYVCARHDIYNKNLVAIMLLSIQCCEPHIQVICHTSDSKYRTLNTPAAPPCSCDRGGTSHSVTAMASLSHTHTHTQQTCDQQHMLITSTSALSRTHTLPHSLFFAHPLTLPHPLTHSPSLLLSHRRPRAYADH